MKVIVILGVLAIILLGCESPVESTGRSMAELKVIDLGADVTEDLPYRIWGKRQLSEFGFDEPNSFKDIEGFEPMYFVDSYYTLFNHGGLM